MAASPERASLHAAYQEIDRLKLQVDELDRKLSQLQLLDTGAESIKHRQSQTAYDALTVQMPKSRSTAALDRLNASTELLNAEQVAMSSTRVVMHQIVLPSDTDSLGICFGGQVLGWIDVCAGLAAKTVAKGPCVTASLDAVHFLRPCRVVCC